MKMIPHLFRRILPSAALAALVVSLPPALKAQYVWDGGFTGNSWGSAANWDPDVAPTFGTSADILFNTMTRPANYVGAARTVRSITYGVNVTGAFGTGTQTFAGGTAANLTFSGGGSGATITVNSGATGDITIGNIGTNLGSIVLGDNLAVAHNGSGVLNLNRPITGAFNVTKTGTGTLQLGAANTFSGTLNVNEGTVRAATSSATGGDLNTLAGINLGGGTLEIRSSSVPSSKTYDIVPVTVSSASTLIYQNTNDYNILAQFTGAVTFALNADLAVKNNSAIVTTPTALTSGLNIARNITGSGRMTVETLNDIAASSANYALGRVLLSGDNSSWSGGLTVAKGTASLAGNAVNAAGTGAIVIGTTGNAFGAGLTFFPSGTNGSTVTYANDITVRSGGFRSIKASNTDHNITLNGTITLEGNLNVDHTLSTASRFLTLGGVISGTGGLDITRAGGNASTAVVLSGANTFSGSTTVGTGATLQLNNNLALQNSALNTSGAGVVTLSSVTTPTIGGLTGGTNLASVITTGYSNVTALTLNVGTGASLAYSGIIADGAAGMTLTKTGAGTQTLSGANTYTGSTTVAAGTLSLGASNSLADVSNIILSGGTLATNSFADTVGTLSLLGNSTIDFTGGGSFAFANSAAATWTGGMTLSLTSGFVSGSSLRFGADASGLGLGQLAQITGGGYDTFSLDSSGYLVGAAAIPEPSTYAAMAGLAALGCAFWRRRRAAVAVAKQF